MRRVFIALTLTTFGGSCTMAKPPPPAHASDLTASEALAATRAWEGFGALAGWDAEDPVLEPLPGPEAASALSFTLRTPAAAAPSGVRYGVAIRLVVDAETGSPRADQQETVRRTVALSDVLPVAEADPVVADFAASVAAVERGVSHDARRGAACVELKGRPVDGYGPRLSWCVGQGVVGLDEIASRLSGRKGFEGLAEALAGGVGDRAPVAYSLSRRSDGAWLVRVQMKEGRSVKRVARRTAEGWQIEEAS